MEYWMGSEASVLSFEIKQFSASKRHGFEVQAMGKDLKCWGEVRLLQLILHIK